MISKASALTIACSLLIGSVVYAETASLKMRFVLDGEAAIPTQINARPGVAPAGVPILNERILVDPISKGIQNVVVYVDTGRRGSKLDIAPYQGVKRQLVAANGRFDPHVLLTRAGDSLEVINRGPMGHNANIGFFKNPSRGFLVPPGKPIVIPLELSEPAPLPICCNIHPWMSATLLVLDHSFAAVSDSNGVIRIDGMPANTRLIFRVFHEAGQINEVEIDGQQTIWNDSRFAIEMVSGMNDLGDVLVPSASLSN